jgi:hypothetical protein
MTLMKLRRRIASPKAWDYVDPAFGMAITAGIGERQNGFGGSLALQQRAKSCRYRSRKSSVALSADSYAYGVVVAMPGIGPA